MNAEFDLKKIWGSQRAIMPDVSAIRQAAIRYRKKELRKMIFSNILLIATIVFIITVTISSPVQNITTPIGIGLISIAIIGYLIFHNQLYALVNKLNLAENNKEYLQQLIKIKQQQTKIQTTIITAYMIVLSAGVFFAVYEHAQRLSTVAEIAFYSATAGWFLLVWFYFRPRSIKKQNAKIDPLIQQFQNLANQFND